MNDIDTLMDRITIVNGKDPGDITPEDIDSLVDFYRYRRTRKATFDKSAAAIPDEITPPSRSAQAPLVGSQLSQQLSQQSVRRFTRK